MCYHRALGYQKGDPGEWSHEHSMALGVVIAARRGTVYCCCSLIGLKTHYAASIDGIDFHPLHEMSCSLDLMNPVLASFCVSSCLSHRLFLKCVMPFFLCAAAG